MGLGLISARHIVGVCAKQFTFRQSLEEIKRYVETHIASLSGNEFTCEGVPAKLFEQPTSVGDSTVIELRTTQLAARHYRNAVQRIEEVFG